MGVSLGYVREILLSQTVLGPDSHTFSSFFKAAHSTELQL